MLSRNKIALIGMPTVPVYEYSRKDYGYLMDTGHPYPYHIGVVEHAQRYGTAYGMAVLWAYGKYGNDNEVSHPTLTYRMLSKQGCVNPFRLSQV